VAYAAANVAALPQALRALPGAAAPLAGLWGVGALAGAGLSTLPLLHYVRLLTLGEALEAARLVLRELGLAGSRRRV